MIKTKELMLGNWVYAGAKTQFPMYVVGVFDDFAYLDFEGNESDMWEEEEEDYRYCFYDNTKELLDKYITPQEAFAHLINNVSRKDVWKENPYVFVYDFELVK